MASLILASTSAYRRELLERLRLPFDCARPDVDEQPREGEPPVVLAQRLARDKAMAVAATHPGAWVIGSDQVADLDGRPLGKPADPASARAQLAAMSGGVVRFHTAVHLQGPGGSWGALDTTEVHFRQLGSEEITRYIEAEQPLDCAGSFKCEGLGITLFDAIRTSDPSALVGLPLIAMSRLLRQAGFTLP